MASKLNICFWNGKFHEKDLEKSFQSYVYPRNLKNNVIGLSVVLLIHMMYGFAESVDSLVPDTTVAIRLSSVAFSALILACLTRSQLRRYQEYLATIIVCILSIAMNAMIYVQPDLDNNYYIGLIQGYIVISLLLRIGFLNMLAVLVVSQSSFVWIAFSKSNTELAMLQSANLMTVGVLCIVGIYLLQRYQREDFLKNRIIEKQNAQLKVHLEASRHDNERKIAALNVLVHFIKTPLHQITGFSDVLVGSVTEGASQETSQNARFIRSASQNLTKSINGLLCYHRLDEAEAHYEAEKISLTEIVDDMSELSPEGVDFEKSVIEKPKVAADPRITRVMIHALAEYLFTQEYGATSVSMSLQEGEDMASLVIEDNAAVVSAEHFKDLTLPLTEINNYLGQTGDQMAMSLRTAARALEIIGGDIDHVALPAGNRYVLSFPYRSPTKIAA